MLELKGVDNYNPATGQVASRQGANEIECLMIDTDYDGSAYFAPAIHFPRQSEDRRLKRLEARLGAQLDSEHWKTCLSANSNAFPGQESGEVAVANHHPRTGRTDSSANRPICSLTRAYTSRTDGERSAGTEPRAV